MILGLALALACAVATNVAFLFKHRGAVAASPVRVRHPLQSAAALFRSRWFTLGWVVALCAWGLHVGALALAPLSIVQAVLSGGLVFLAVLAERYFGFHLGRRQWIGLTITAAGLVVIGLTSGADPGKAPGYALAALISVECAVIVLATALAAAAISGRHRFLRAREGILLGVAAGALFGVSDIALKYLTHAVGNGGVIELLSPWSVAALAASVIAFYASARSLQLGPGVEVIALTSVAANLIAIAGGILVFRDPIGTGTLEISGRMAAFGLVIAGAALMPGPMRATHPAAEPQGTRPSP